MGLVSAGGPASPFVDLIGPVNEEKSREFRDKNPANEEQAGWGSAPSLTRKPVNEETRQRINSASLGGHPTE